MVTSYRKGEVKGYLTHPRLIRPLEIHSIPQLLFTINDILLQEDAPICPHAFEPGQNVPAEYSSTLRIRVLFREHHTWQGYILWEEEQLQAPFASVLELIEILDEILSN